jgi:hypothetical protein
VRGILSKFALARQPMLPRRGNVSFDHKRCGAGGAGARSGNLYAAVPSGAPAVGVALASEGALRFHYNPLVGQTWQISMSWSSIRSQTADAPFKEYRKRGKQRRVRVRAT